MFSASHLLIWPSLDAFQSGFFRVICINLSKIRNTGSKTTSGTTQEAHHSSRPRFCKGSQFTHFSTNTDAERKVCGRHWLLKQSQTSHTRPRVLCSANESSAQQFELNKDGKQQVLPTLIPSNSSGTNFLRLFCLR